VKPSREVAARDVERLAGPCLVRCFKTRMFFQMRVIAQLAKQWGCSELETCEVVAPLFNKLYPAEEFQQ
jgi:hypothetical protein